MLLFYSVILDSSDRIKILALEIREAKTLICSTFFVKDVKGYLHLATFQPSSTSDLENLEEAMGIVKSQLFPLNYEELLAS